MTGRERVLTGRPCQTNVARCFRYQNIYHLFDEPLKNCKLTFYASGPRFSAHIGVVVLTRSC